MSEIEYLKKYLTNKTMEEALTELETGRPVQYIVGDVNFYGFKIMVDERVLIPRFETEELVSKLISYSKGFSKPKILELGVGSGCISIALSKKLEVSVDAVDLSLDALEVAKKNIMENSADVNLIHGDMFENVVDKYDIIVSNPPYIDPEDEIDPLVYENEPHMALFVDGGIFFYDKILKESRDYINEKAIIAFEIGHKQGVDLIRLANEYYPNSTVKIEKDLQGRDRFAFVFIGII